MEKKGAGKICTERATMVYQAVSNQNDVKLKEYDLTPTKYSNPLITKHQVKSLALTNKQELFVMNDASRSRLNMDRVTTGLVHICNRLVYNASLPG